MKKLMVLTVILAMQSFSTPGRAEELPGDKDKDERPHSECFNIVCDYRADHDSDDRDGPFHQCRAASVFKKLVTEQGEEIRDRSSFPNNPALDVQCDGRTVFNNSARRFTDDLGTRIQAEEGPYPAILLPRGVLTDRHQYSVSQLELEGQSLSGFCYVYTGPQ